MLSIFRSIFRQLIRRPMYFVKRHITKFIIAYIIGLFPMGYVLTGLTTGTPLTQLNSVVNVMKQSGITNIASMGVLKPLENGGKAIIGNVTAKLGDWTNSTTLTNYGTNLVTGAKSWFNSGNTLASSTADTNQTVSSDDPYGILSWNFNDYPNYYRVIGLSDINVSTFPQAGSIIYGDLDALGRTTKVVGTINYDMVKKSAETKRTSIPTSQKPSGWPKNSKVSIPWLYGKTYNGYMYNKSHLIADSLGGEAITQNLITGTRSQNVGGTDQNGGMRYTEKKAVAYLKEHKDAVVYYQSEPLYYGNELVPRAVMVDIYTTDGTLNEKVLVYNYANGWTINYNDASYQTTQN